MSLKDDPYFSQQDFEVVKRETKYKGFFELQKLTLKHKLFGGGETTEFTRELFVRGPVVAVLLYDPVKDSVVLNEQFRVGALDDDRSPWLYELVAGIIDAGETPEEVAHREALEEAGCELQQLEPIYQFWVSPGADSEQVHFFCGCVDSSGVGGIYGLPNEHEDIRVTVVPSEIAWQAVESGKIRNALSIIGLQWLQLNKASLIQKWT